jgi:hypothetical protein
VAEVYDFTAATQGGVSMLSYVRRHSALQSTFAAP